MSLPPGDSARLAISFPIRPNPATLRNYGALRTDTTSARLEAETDPCPNGVKDAGAKCFSLLMAAGVFFWFHPLPGCGLGCSCLLEKP